LYIYAEQEFAGGILLTRTLVPHQIQPCIDGKKTMMKVAKDQMAPVPRWLRNYYESNNKGYHSLAYITSPQVVWWATVFFGILFLSLLAQVRLYTPWSPVPITGQSFGVLMIGLLYGRKLAGVSVGTYLILGFTGAPVFAGTMASFSFGPSTGYLLGMLLSSQIVGGLADSGWTKSFFKCYGAALISSAVILTCGVLFLSLTLPLSQAFAVGALPFLAGDLIKSLTACALISSLEKKDTHC